MSTATLNENIKAIKEYQELGRPKSYRNMIALNNIKLIYDFLHRNNYYSDKRDNEELEQEAFILLLEAIDKFNPDKGASFSTFLYIYLKKTLGKTQIYNIDKSLDEPLQGYEDENITLADTIESEEATDEFDCVEDDIEAQEIRKEVKKSLSDDIVKIIFANYGIAEEEKTQKKLAQKHGVSQSRINAIIKKAKQDLRGNQKLFNIWIEYENIDIMNTGSILAFKGSKTNNISNIVERSAFRRLKLEDNLYIMRKKIIDERIQREIEDIKIKCYRGKL